MFKEPFPSIIAPKEDKLTVPLGVVREVILRSVDPWLRYISPLELGFISAERLKTSVLIGESEVPMPSPALRLRVAEVPVIV